MDWGSEVGQNVRFGLAQREARRQYDLSRDLDERRLALMRAAEERIQNSEIYDRLTNALENPYDLESTMPGVDPAGMSYLALTAARDPRGAAESPDYMATRARVMEAFAGPYQELLDEEREAEMRRASARRFNPWDHIAAGRGKSYYRALEKGAEPYRGTEAFSWDEGGNMSFLTPQQFGDLSRRSAGETAQGILEAPMPYGTSAVTPRLPPGTQAPWTPKNPPAPPAPVRPPPRKKTQGASKLMRAPDGQPVAVPPELWEEARRNGWTDITVPVSPPRR